MHTRKTLHFHLVQYSATRLYIHTPKPRLSSTSHLPFMSQTTSAPNATHPISIPSALPRYPIPYQTQPIPALRPLKMEQYKPASYIYTHTHYLPYSIVHLPSSQSRNNLPVRSLPSAPETLSLSLSLLHVRTTIAAPLTSERIRACGEA